MTRQLSHATPTNAKFPRSPSPTSPVSATFPRVAPSMRPGWSNLNGEAARERRLPRRGKALRQFLTCRWNSLHVYSNSSHFVGTPCTWSWNSLHFCFLMDVWKYHDFGCLLLCISTSNETRKISTYLQEILFLESSPAQYRQFSAFEVFEKWHLRFWDLGILKPWNLGILETLKLWFFGI